MHPPGLPLIPESYGEASIGRQARHNTFIFSTLVLNSFVFNYRITSPLFCIR
jgi:hypothetical protein